MGRTPCCDKVGLKKGPWTPEEDQKLLAYDQHGHGSWRALPGKAGGRPLPRRTDNEIKNYWNTHLKKRLDKMGIDPVTHKPKNESLLSINGPSKSSANLSHLAQWESARLEAEARLARQSKLRANSMASSPPAKLLPPVTPPPPCLDILKAWSGMWTNSPESGSGGEELESPTSTLTFSENNGTGNGGNSAAFIEFVGNSVSSMKEESEEGWQNVTDLPAFNSSLCLIYSAWAASIEGNKNGNENENQNVNGENFIARFTDLLLNNNSLLATSDEPESGGGSEFYGEKKNYWNNILLLINASLTDSPVF